MPLDPEQITQTGVNPYDNGAGDGGDTGDPLGSGPTAKPYVFNSGEIGYQIGSKVYHADGSVATSDPYVSHATGGSTTVVNASTGGAHYSTFYGPQGYGTYETSSGVPILIGLKEDPSNSYTNPLDKNNDGLNDSTGWANGVFKDSSSPSGFYYASNGQYIPVTPDGAPYNGPDLSGGGGGGSLKTITVQGPKGYGSYVLNSDGSLGNFIGDTRAPSASSAAVSGSRAGSTSSGGSSGSSAALSAQISADAAAARQAADQAFQQQQAADGRLYSAQQAQLDRQLRAAEDAAQNEKDRAAIQNQRAQLALQATQQFQQAVSSTDPIAFAAFLAANGNISNGLANGQTALSDRALVPAANILQLLNSGMGLQDIPTHDANYYLNQGGGGTGTTNTTGGGLPTGGTGTTGGTGDTTGAGGATGTGGLPTGSTTGSGWQPSAAASNAAAMQVAQDQADLERRMPGSPGSFDLGAQAGVPLTVQQRNDFANAAYGNWVTDSSAAGALNFGNYTPYVTQTQASGITGGLPSAPAYPQITPAAYNTVNTAPAGTSGPLGTANGTHIDVATGRLVPNQPVPQAAVPAVTRMASGGHIGGLPTRNLVPTIVGDRHDNKVSGTEELAFLPPGAHVLSHEDTKRALGGTTGLQRALRGGLPRADLGDQLLQMYGSAPTQPPQDPYGYGYNYSTPAPAPASAPVPAGYVVQQYPNEQGHYETQYIGGYPTNVWVANPSYNAGLNQYGQPIQSAPPPPAPAPQPTPAPAPQPTPAPVQQPSGGTVSPVPTPPPATTPTTATGGLPTSTGTTTSSSTPPLNTTPGPTVTTPSGTTTQLPSTTTTPAPTTNTTGGGLPTGTPSTTATTPPLTGTAQNAVNTLPSQYTSGNLVTPDNQAYVDYVRNLRTGVQYPNLNMYSVDYASIDPTVRDIYEKGLQDQFGIPQSSSQFEQQKYQLRGLPTGAASVTY